MYDEVSVRFEKKFYPNDKVVLLASTVLSTRGVAVPEGTKGTVIANHGPTCDVDFLGYGRANTILHIALERDSSFHISMKHF